MKLKKLIWPLLSVTSMIGLALSANAFGASNHALLSKGVVARGLKKAASATELGYQEYYYGTSSTRGYRVIFDELYISLTESLTWAWRTAGITKCPATSIESAHESYLKSETNFANVFDSDTGVDLYQQLKTIFDANVNEDGLAPMNEEMIPILNKIYENIALKNGLSGTITDCWDRFCFYKGHEDGENPYLDDPSILNEGKKPTLLYGDENLKDEDAFILLVMGDGFTAEQLTTSNSYVDSYGKSVACRTFDEAAPLLSQYMMDTEPFSLYKDTIKIYSLDIASEESGVSNDTNDDKKVGDASLQKNTYFETSFWADGVTTRLISISQLGLLKMNSLARYLLPQSDFAGLLVNSTRYGGSGGTYCTCSLAEGTEEDYYSSDAREIFIHEIAHTIANLADEYYANDDSYFGEHPNMSCESKKANLPWADFIGVDNVDRFAYMNGEDVVIYHGTAWYKPTDKTCKMELLGKDHPFCRVCSEAMQKNISKNANTTNLTWQPYNRLFKRNADTLYMYRNGEIEKVDSFNIPSYVYVRKGESENLLSDFPDLVTTTYLDRDGIEVASPSAIGDYTAKISFKGNEQYDSKSISVNFSITEYIPPSSDEDSSEPEEPSSVPSSEPDTPVDPVTPEKSDNKAGIIAGCTIAGIAAIGATYFIIRHATRHRRKLKRRL